MEAPNHRRDFFEDTILARRIKILLLAFLSFISCTSSLRAEDAVIPYEASWPKGWAVEKVAKGGGVIVRAKTADDGFEPSIRVTCFPIVQGLNSPKEELTGTIESCRKEYAKAGFTMANNSAIKSCTINGKQAYEAEYSLLGKDRASVKQWLTFLFTGGRYYTVTCSTRLESWSKYQPIFASFRNSLRLK